MKSFNFRKNEDAERHSGLMLQWNFNFGHFSKPLSCQEMTEDSRDCDPKGASDCSNPVPDSIQNILTNGSNATNVQVSSALTPNEGETLVGVDIHINGTKTSLNSTASQIEYENGISLYGQFPGGVCNKAGTQSNFLTLTSRWYDGFDEYVYSETIGFFGRCAQVVEMHESALTGYQEQKVDGKYTYENVLVYPGTTKNFDVGHEPYPLLNQDGHNILSVPDETVYTSIKIAAQPQWTHGGFENEITDLDGAERDTVKIRTRFHTSPQKFYGELYVVQYRAERVDDTVETFKRRITSTDIEQTEPITGFDSSLPIYVVPNDIAYIVDVDDPVPDHIGKIKVIVQPIE